MFCSPFLSKRGRYRGSVSVRHRLGLFDSRFFQPQRLIEGSLNRMIAGDDWMQQKAFGAKKPLEHRVEIREQILNSRNSVKNSLRRVTRGVLYDLGELE